MNEAQIKEKLLGLPDIEIEERKKIRADYYFYKGKSPDLEKAEEDPATIGQNWQINDNVDYKPTQDIRNKIKPRLKKQARFMFGKEPTITFKPNNLNDKEKCEELRKFIDDVFETNKFWKNTRKAFLMSTIKKRALLRVEANPGVPIKIKYENIEDFYYKEIDDALVEVKFFEADRKNVFAEKEDEKLYNLHIYFYKSSEEGKAPVAWYRKETYKGDNLDKPIESKENPTGFDKIPCWLIKNGGELNDIFGESDLEDLKDTQNQYNRRISDYADALRFQMFGADSVIDGNPDDVAQLKVAPGAMHAIRTRDDAPQGVKATHEKLEYNFSSSEAINSYLDRATQDMDFVLDMPSLKDLANIPSAKAMKYLYNDLIGRCEEKWNDWEPLFKDLIDFIIEASKYCYCGCFKEEWRTLDYTTVFAHNYPLPSDEEDKKKLGLDEVEKKTRSIRSYMKEFSNEEDTEKALNEVIEEVKWLNEATMADSFQKSINSELNDQGDGIKKNLDGEEK